MDGGRYQLKPDPWSSHAVILSRLGAGRGRRLLDVGAADGFLAEALSRAGWEVTGIEGDAELARQACGRCKELIVADLDGELPAVPGPFDAVVYGDVLEHLRDPLRALVHLNRSAAGGTAIVSVPNVAHLWVRLSLLSGRFEYADRGILDRTHLRFFTRRTLLAMLGQAGLAVRELVTTPAPLPLVMPERWHGAWLDRAHALGARAAAWWPGGLAYQFVAVCRIGDPGADGPAARATAAGGVGP